MLSCACPRYCCQQRLDDAPPQRREGRIFGTRLPTRLCPWDWQRALSPTGRSHYSRPGTPDRSTMVTSPPCGGVRSLLRGPGRVAAPWLCTSCGSSRNIFGASNPHSAVFTTSFSCVGGNEMSFLVVLGFGVSGAACRVPAAHSVPIRIANEFLMMTSNIITLPGVDAASTQSEDWRIPSRISCTTQPQPNEL
jgi:hypothetical protein